MTAMQAWERLVPLFYECPLLARKFDDNCIEPLVELSQDCESLGISPKCVLCRHKASGV